MIPRISPTSILKIALFVDMMRKMQSSSSSDGSGIGGGGGVGLLAELLRPAGFHHHPYLPTHEQHYTFERINDRYVRDDMALRRALSMPLPSSSSSSSSSSSWAPTGVHPLVDLLGKVRRRRSGDGEPVPTTTPSSSAATTKTAGAPPESSESSSSYDGAVIILDVTSLDSSVSTMGMLRDQVSFLLSQHRSRRGGEGDLPANEGGGSTIEGTGTVPELEVIALIESPGGSASDYGLAASQLRRLRREPGITLTVCVDKVAASGGYMMACQSSPGRLYAAPLAVVGSIGVVGQALNVHSTLKGWGIRPLVFRGGKNKAPVGMIGEVTDEGMARVQDMVDRTHEAFRDCVREARPGLEGAMLDVVSTGDVWLGRDAVGVGLTDAVATSDEIVGDRVRGGRAVLRLRTHAPRRFPFGGIMGGGGGRQLPGLGAVLGGPTEELSGLLGDLRTVLSGVARLLTDDTVGGEGLGRRQAVAGIGGGRG